MTIAPFQEVHSWAWPYPVPEKVFKIFRSTQFLVQLYHEEQNTVRLSINRVTFNKKTRRWDADISWEELQAIKNACGYADFDAIEIFPKQSDVVNVANMPHLWVLPTPHPLAWRNKKEEVVVENSL
jgi:hypothetical protein